MSVNLQLGSTLPAHATSMGKVLLAGLSKWAEGRAVSAPMSPTC